MAVANGVVYLVSDLGFLYAKDAATGATLFSFDLGGGLLPPQTPIVANGMLYVGSGYQRDLVYGFGLPAA